MSSLSGSPPTLHCTEVLQAEVVGVVHHNGPGRRQPKLGSGAAPGGGGGRFGGAFFLLVFHLFMAFQTWRGERENFTSYML